MVYCLRFKVYGFMVYGFVVYGFMVYVLPLRAPPSRSALRARLGVLPTVWSVGFRV